MSARIVQFSPNHPIIRQYHRSLAEIRSQSVEHESALRLAFQDLLRDSARLHGWSFIAELGAKAGGHLIRPDGTLRDHNSLPRGYWEAKDTRDDLERAIEQKKRLGYPVNNTIFEDTRRAILYQDRAPVFQADLTDPRAVADLLDRFYSHTEEAIREFDEAVDVFQQRVPDLARGLAAKIEEAHRSNQRFQAAFDQFFSLCQGSLNPNIRREAVDEMLVQHLLTERLFRTIFDNPEFTRRNAIAAEVEQVIDALVSESFSRSEFLKGLDPFYVAIEGAARGISVFREKQQFLNSIYERFFRGYSVKVADTHGIIYTPQPIVDFMWTSVAEALDSEFGRSLSSPEVCILDPCTGTGNFIANLLPRLSRRDLPRMYRDQIFANEVMLMPYYIAALNIEHAYLALAGKYEPFEGLCFVDTLDIPEKGQMRIVTEKNAQRVERQRQAPITVIIGNPPYNVGQINENDNNKNRKYAIIDPRVSATYAKDSKATSVSKLNDPYVKFFRWATDRLGERDGIVCFVSNNSFVHQYAFDGMRKHLFQDFTRIDHADLHGNVRKNPKLSGTTHNVFGIQVGVGITLAVRCKQEKRLRYCRVPESWRKEQKLAWLNERKVGWQILQPDGNHTWLVPQHAAEFQELLAIDQIFSLHSLGVATHRDEVVYGFHREPLIARIKQFTEDYNAEVDRWRRSDRKANIDDFVRYDRIKWSETLKHHLRRQTSTEFDENKIRWSIYRPFTKKFLCFDQVLIDRVYQFDRVFPTPGTEEENRAIAPTALGSEKPFMALVIDRTCDLHLVGAGCGTQCFPFYTYDPDGSHRRENITDDALQRFRSHYQRPGLNKWDIFYYVYALLHHPGYRERFAENLKRELPRIPFAPDFPAFVKAGRELARLHLNYEQLDPYPLKFIEDHAHPFSLRVLEKMRLSKDRTALAVNPSLTLAGIPPEAFEYRLGNRSALEWIIDQYRVTEDSCNGIRSDPNRPDDPEYIARLVGQVIRVSVETVSIIKPLPPSFT